MTSYQRLADDHRRIEDLTSALASCVDSRQSQPCQAYDLLHALTIELDEHLAFEDCALYPKLMLASGHGSVKTAAQFRVDLTILKADWTSYLSEWSSEAIASDWSTYADETRRMLARIEARVRAENELLYPAALQRSAISLREIG